MKIENMEAAKDLFEKIQVLKLHRETVSRNTESQIFPHELMKKHAREKTDWIDAEILRATKEIEKL